jgi:ferredoxin-NADP reductase
MARSLNGSSPAVDFFYCVEHEAEAHFFDELRSIASERDDFRVVVVPRDSDGFITAERLAAGNADLGSADVLVCGPPAMIVSLRSQLRAQGVPAERIHAEEFSFAKVGRPRTDSTEVSRSALAEDPKLLASVAAVAFAGPVLALVVLVGSYLVAGGG